MSEFTKEEIRLCKQVACRHRKEIVRGDRYVHIGDNRNEPILSLDHESLTFRNLIPLWTISDCLEFLKIECTPLRMQIRDDSYAHLQGWNWQVHWGNPNATEGKPWGGSINAPTLLEALLKAVLAVLEEEPR